MYISIGKEVRPTINGVKIKLMTNRTQQEVEIYGMIIKYVEGYVSFFWTQRHSLTGKINKSERGQKVSAAVLTAKVHPKR